ncbi:hypothetical protein GCM10011369_36670 [Neiella marina]|uniref:Uncharacterized protein n=1 Tax=Neiella marina TaxID=508461 RepID=A0A8J2UAV1_9GAMM|nr:hypothetical protein GCM10011369_36670 [Neiella marina]
MLAFLYSRIKGNAQPDTVNAMALQQTTVAFRCQRFRLAGLFRVV